MIAVSLERKFKQGIHQCQINFGGESSSLPVHVHYIIIVPGLFCKPLSWFIRRRITPHKACCTASLKHESCTETTNQHMYVLHNWPIRKCKGGWELSSTINKRGQLSTSKSWSPKSVAKWSLPPVNWWFLLTYFNIVLYF